MKVTKIISNLLYSNTFILQKGGEAIIIDCGCALGEVKDVIKDSKVVGIFLTHGHYDHALYCNEYAKEFSCKIYANANIIDTITNAEAFYSEDGRVLQDLSKLELIKEDCVIQLGNFEIACYSFPGHSPCSEGYVIENSLFAGDFLFAKSFGRIDLINGKKQDMLKSFNKMEGISFYRIYSGHGEESTKDEQLKNLNLYKRFLTR